MDCKFYVYIIHSAKRDIYYKGYSSRPDLRLKQHNENKAKFTSNKGPWQLKFLQSFSNVTEARKRENIIKKYSHEQLKHLIASDLNEFKNSSLSPENTK